MNTENEQSSNKPAPFMVGDSVIRFRHGKPYEIRTVVKVTEKFLQLNDGTCWTHDGSEYPGEYPGCRWKFPDFIQHPTPGDIAFLNLCAALSKARKELAVIGQLATESHIKADAANIARAREILRTIRELGREMRGGEE